MRENDEPSVRLERPKPLEDMSVEELDAYAGKLDAELEKVRAVAEGKRNYISGAQGLFKI